MITNFRMVRRTIRMLAVAERSQLVALMRFYGHQKEEAERLGRDDEARRFRLLEDIARRHFNSKSEQFAEVA